MKKTPIIILLLILSIAYLYFSYGPVKNGITSKQNELNHSSNFTIIAKNISVSTTNNSTTQVNQTSIQNLITTNTSNFNFSFNLTKSNEFCGDTVCSNSEKSNCCSDCGCTAGKVCNYGTLTCQTALPPFSQSKINEIITNFKKTYSNYANYTFNLTYDSTLNDKPVRVIVLNCQQSNPTCAASLVVNAQGEILTTYNAN